MNYKKYKKLKRRDRTRIKNKGQKERVDRRFWFTTRVEDSITFTTRIVDGTYSKDEAKLIDEDNVILDHLNEFKERGFIDIVDWGFDQKTQLLRRGFEIKILFCGLSEFRDH